MEWSDRLQDLYRGLQLGSHVVKSRLDAARTATQAQPHTPGRLVQFDGFGDNPGKLRMLAHVPALCTGGPIVVLLHGCGQSAADFAFDSGWIALADRLRFPLILPEQMEANNSGRCFQWFQHTDTARDQGEAASLAAMTRAAIHRFDGDTRRVFVLGLSAGGAMTAALLAAYPDLFAAGAVIAGLPVGTASSGVQALMRMASAGHGHSSDDWAKRVRALAPSGFAGPWPRLSIWHGQADHTVAPENGNQLAQQWRALHGLDDHPGTRRVVNGVEHHVWPDSARPLVEQWSLPSLPHAYPAGTRQAPPGHYVSQAPVDATASIARFFALD